MQLTFEAADFRYAIDVSDVVEVVPWVDVQPVAGTPDWLRGYFSYRGVVTPRHRCVYSGQRRSVSTTLE